MSHQTVTIADTTFDYVRYDRDADVLYLSVGRPRPADHTFGTPEGHAVRMDHENRITGITLVNAGALLDDGDLEVTLPRVVGVRRSDLAEALAG